MKTSYNSIKRVKSYERGLKGGYLMEDNRKYGSERERTIRLYNMQLYDGLRFTADKWQMPIISNDNYIPQDLISFNYALNTEPKECGIHFYIDDYQFERVWRAPERYLELFKKYGCILTPDFSCYLDIKTPQQIFNIYRSRLIGAYYQKQGIKVIPTISWSDTISFEYCFKGIPKGSIVSVSTVGIIRKSETRLLFKNGLDEMIRQIEPKTILIYGKEFDYDFKNIDIRYCNNKNSEWRSKYVKN